MKPMNLVFVHGFLGNALNWLPILQRMRKVQESGELAAWKFHSFDLLGHGKKAGVDDSARLNLKSVAFDLARSIETALGDEDFLAVGHSFGLRPLLMGITDELWGKQLKHLLVEDSSPVISEKGYEDLTKIFNQIKPPFKDRSAAKEALDLAFGVDSKMARFLMTNMAQDSEGNFHWKFNAKLMEELLEDSKRQALWQAWESFDGPIDMIMGASSSFVPKSRVEECVNRRSPKLTKVHFIDGAGHWVHSDQPDLFSEILVSIIKKY